MLVGASRKSFVGSLNDALAADVDPRACRHLPVHHQALLLELAEVLPVRPLADQVRVGDENARRHGVGAKDADRLSALDEQGLVVFELAQSADNGVEAIPVARRLPGAAVDDQVFGALGNLGVEVVHQHPERGFLLPALATDLGSARGAHDGSGSHTDIVRLQ